LGLVAGLALIAGGEYWQKKYPIWSQPLTGAGIAVLYLSIFVAFAPYELIPPLVGFGLFILITLAAAALALRYESRPIAVIGIFGGFGQMAMAEALRIGETHVVLPMDFTRLIWISLIAYVAFAEVPGLFTWIGGGIIFAATAFIAWRERTLRAPPTPKAEPA
ncbi:MAG: DUF2339 domain-containing protein, partial [Proteobacteria bacterium]|nr:DUF2339 domain-containing protein [Pseudomonadota bacterium]